MIGDPPRRARKRDRRYSSVAWRRVREQVRRRDNFTCQACGKREPFRGRSGFPVDHKDPGADFYDPAGLWLLCWSCNTSKGDLSVAQWYATAKRPAPARSHALTARSPYSDRPEAEPTFAPGRPSMGDRHFGAWALSLPLVSREPEDHEHGRWGGTALYTRGKVFGLCPAHCRRDPVRWEARA